MEYLSLSLHNRCLTLFCKLYVPTCSASEEQIRKDVVSATLINGAPLSILIADLFYLVSIVSVSTLKQPRNPREHIDITMGMK